MFQYAIFGGNPLARALVLFLQLFEGRNKMRSILDLFGISVLLTMAILSLAMPEIAKAQENLDCKPLSPVSGFLGYKSRNNGSWCEGFYKPKVSGTIALVGLGTKENKCTDPSGITIGLYHGVDSGAGHSNTSNISVVGQSASLGLYYRYDRAFNESYDDIEISTSTVIEPSSISLDHIFFAGTSGQSTIPVKILTKPKVGTQCTNLPESRFVATLIFYRKVKEIRWRWGQCENVDNTWSVIEKRFQVPPLVPTSLQLSPLPNSLCKLEIRAKDSDDGWLSGSFQVSKFQ